MSPVLRFAVSALSLGAVLVLPIGCGGDEGGGGGAPLVAATGWLDEDRYLGEPLEVENLTVWPVYTRSPLDVGEFLTLDEAREAGVVDIREVGAAGSERIPPNAPQTDESAPQTNEPAPETEAEPPSEAANLPFQQIEFVVEDAQLPVPAGQVRQAGQVLAGDGAQVNTLVIENRGDLPLLVVAGTVVKGGKQDRQIGQDFVVAAHSTVPVDAFCVEPGRWSPRVGQDAAFGFTSFGAVAPKEVRLQAQYAKDQQEVWNEVRVVLRCAAVAGDTTTLLAANEQADGAAAARREGIERAVLDHFAALAAGPTAPVGFAYAVRGKPEAVRAFSHERLLRSHLPAFAKTMALEAELAGRAAASDEVGPPAVSAADVVALVKAIGEAPREVEATRAGNWNGYRKTERGFNGACFLSDPDGRRTGVVLTEDWTSK